MISELLHQFDLDTRETEVKNFGSGLINNTWLVKAQDKRYILQKINENVFRQPQAIDDNISAIDQYLKKKFPSYIFTSPVLSSGGKSLLRMNDGSFRLFEFIEGSHSYTVIENTELAYEAAKQFGKFTRLLAGFDINQLKITLPDFHNLTLRHFQFTNAIQNASAERLTKAKKITDALHGYYDIVQTFEAIKTNRSFIKRVTHHDTKISNVLFDKNNKAICIIDLDTVMPGYFISDVGDMMRTYLSPAGEEEIDFSKIDVRESYFDAIVQGYLSEMHVELTNDEKQYFVYAGKFMIYMQALRFIADYLNNDVYYGAKYELHNFNRAINQLTLLNILVDKETELNKRVDTFISRF
jgi:Ser/Thr protein kinase RdoA (MazF antagonist)